MSPFYFNGRVCSLWKGDRSLCVLLPHQLVGRESSIELRVKFEDGISSLERELVDECQMAQAVGNDYGNRRSPL